MRATCQCGELTATIDDGAEPFVVACHCVECQKRSGSPFGVMAYFEVGDVAIRGEVSEYTRAAEGESTFTTGFCPTCGSTIYGRASRHPDLVGITVGTITDPAFPAPERSIYERNQHHWVTMPDAALGFVRGADGERSR